MGPIQNGADNINKKNAESLFKLRMYIKFGNVALKLK